MNDTSHTKQSTRINNSPQLKMIIEPQDALFYIAIGWTGGMGSVRVMDEQGPFNFGNYPIYLQEDIIDEILNKGGGLPDCFVGSPKIKVYAKIRLEKKTEINESIPGAPKEIYYQAYIGHIYDVMIHVESCT